MVLRKARALAGCSAGGNRAVSFLCDHWASDGAGGYQCVSSVSPSSCSLTAGLQESFYSGASSGGKLIGPVLPVVLVVAFLARLVKQRFGD